MNWKSSCSCYAVVGDRRDTCVYRVRGRDLAACVRQIRRGMHGDSDAGTGNRDRMDILAHVVPERVRRDGDDGA
jgi:hypothetical protein